jgi:autotransporter strand-loop-strand O-heptosyltransferase
MKFVNIDDVQYDMSSPNSKDFTKRNIISFGDIPLPNVNILWHHIDGFELTLISDSDEIFDVEIYDNNKKLLYSAKLSNGMYCKLNRKYFAGIEYKIYFKGVLIKSENINFAGNRILIGFESSSLGDTLAWLPYCDIFAKKHNCEVIVSTFMNQIFESQYPNLTFINPGVVVNNIHGLFKLGWFYNIDMEPQFPSTIPLQKSATNILGLEYNEVRPKLNFTKSERPIDKKYITIGMTTTAGCKEWSYDGGWQKLINNLKDLGYEIAIIQKEPVDPNIDGVLDWTGNYPLEVRMNQLYHSEFYIGLGSGLSWLAWAMNKHVVMIANFSEDGHEFTNNTTRITNTFVCNGCWNNPKFKFDKGDWYWCPEHKGTERQFECHKSITSDMVINRIQHLL